MAATDEEDEDAELYGAQCTQRPQQQHQRYRPQKLQLSSHKCPKETDRSRDATTVMMWVQHLRTVLMMPLTISVIGKFSTVYHRLTRRNKLCLELAGQILNSVLDTGTVCCIIDAYTYRKIKGVPPLDKPVLAPFGL